MSNLLSYIKLKNVPVKEQIALCRSLEENLTHIINSGGHPQFIATLTAQNREVFEVLASVPDNGLTGTQKLFYDINIGNGDWSQVVADQIKTAKYQFEANKEPGTYHGFFEKPYATIKDIIRKHGTKEMISIINESLIPLCTDVLTSQVPAEIKKDCIDCLCDVLVHPNFTDIVLTSELTDAIERIDVSDTYSILGSSRSILSCRVLMLQIITGIADKDDMLEWCFDFAKKDQSTKAALAECIEQYLRNYVHDPTKIDAMILSIIIQCFEDEYWPVRRTACNCLVRMLATRYKDRVECKLYEGAVDPSHYVRNHLLVLCQNGEIEYTSISTRIIDILKNDANYAIRIYANQIVMNSERGG